MDNAEPRSSRLLSAMPETHPTPDPIQIRPRLRRQSPNLRELRTKKTRTLGSRDVLPRLLTSLQAMLLDLRERPNDSRQRTNETIESRNSLVDQASHPSL